MIEALVVLGLLGAVDGTTIVVALVSVILGGGLTGGLMPFLKFRTEKDSAIAVGAEAAVQSLTAALARSDLRVNKLETELEKSIGIIEELKGIVANVTRDLEATKARLDAALNGIKEK